MVKQSVDGARRGFRYRPLLGCSTDKEEAGIHLTPPANGVLTEDSLFVAFSLPFLRDLATFAKELGRPSVTRLLSDRDQARALSLPGMPVSLGSRRPGDPSLESRLDSAPLGAQPRIAILNPFGFALGDTIVLLAALREFQRRLEERGARVQLDVLQHPDNVETEDLYLQSGLVRAVHHLPVPLRALAEYDAYVDFSSSMMTRGLCWTDDILEMLGIDHTSVAYARKRNALNLQAAKIGPLRQLIRQRHSRPEPLVLFHGRASEAIRSMPEPVMGRVLETILERTDWTLVTLHPVPLSHPRILDWSALSSNFQRFAYIISEMDGFLCVDTCVYHVAAAFDVPGVALFTTVLPRLRAAIYPCVYSILIGGDANRLVNGHGFDGDANAHVESLWAAVDVGSLVGTLEDAVLAHRRGAPPRHAEVVPSSP